jgi:putative transposase
LKAVYVAFVIDAFSRRITGWRAATTMTTALVLDALEHAVWTRARAGVTDLAGLVHHHDAGRQYTSIAFTKRLVQPAPIPRPGQSATPTTTPWPRPQSACSRPSSSRLRGRGGTWTRSKAAALEWVHWYNTERTHQAIDDLTPVAAEELHYRYRAALDQAG